MPVSKNDSKKMQRLAQEGKKISKILSEDFPDLDYLDVYFAVHEGGERSSLGVKREITNRLSELVENTIAKDRRKQSEVLHELIGYLYNSHKTNTAKLAKIRAALGE